MNPHNNALYTFSVFVFLLFIFQTSIVVANTIVYKPGDTVTVGEFVYNDDFTPTSDICTVSIFSPSGVALVNDVAMTVEVAGWQYYNFVAPVTNGMYASFITCGTLITGDLVKADKSFIVADPVVTDSSISTSVWGNGSRTLTAFGSLAADVWNDAFASVRRLTDGTLTNGGILATETYIDALETSVVAEVQANATLINSLNNISALDVWTYGARSLNSGTVALDTASIDAVWDTATSGFSTVGSVGELILTNLDAQVSSRGTSTLSAGDVWSNATRTLSTTGVDDITTDVWSNATRTLSDYGNDITAEDVWNVLSSALLAVGSIGEQLSQNVDAPISSLSPVGGWNVRMGNVERVQTGYTYRTKVFILDSSSAPAAPFSVPTVTLFDPDRNLVVTNIPMTLVTTGVYEYTYTVANNASQGLWEAVASTEVDSGNTIQTNDYFEVAGSPAQVLINSVSSTSISDINANVTITNEGLSGYEYQYEWCVVSEVGNECGDGDDEYYATAAKFINPGEDWNTILSAAVLTPGTFYFKLVVYFGTESSGSSRIFTVSNSSGGGGGGGGGGSTGNVVPITPSGQCDGADFNLDNTVNSIDFSILLYFWKAISPFSNPCVDINTDNKVDSVDFSIMLYQWNI